jgi:hypothetical protein
MTKVYDPSSADDVRRHLPTTLADRPGTSSMLQVTSEAGSMNTGSNAPVLQEFYQNDPLQLTRWLH